MEFNNFNDILKYFGFMKYTQDNHRNYSDKDSAEDIENNNNCKNLNLDMNTGFQDINPMLFVIIGEVIANATSGKLPAAVLNAYGNWLQMIGQLIQTFNAQQQYHECGPGRCYNPENRNINNPFCNNNGYSDGKNFRRKKKHRKRKEGRDTEFEIKQLKIQINELINEINILKSSKK